MQTSPHALDAPKPPFWVGLLRREVRFLLDVVVLSGVYLVTLWLRFLEDGAIHPEHYWRLPLVVGIQLATLWAWGIHSFIWRYVGLAELRNFIAVGSTSGIALLGLRLALPDSLHFFRVPISVIALDSAFAVAGLLGIRILRRVLHERFEQAVPPSANPGLRRRALLVGAGRAGMMAAQELQGQSRRGELEVVGFLDDDPRKRDTVIRGLPVLGTVGDLRQMVDEFDVDEVLLTMVRVDGKTIQRLNEECRQLGIEARIMPALWEILDGRRRVSRFREIRIEDILGRDEIHLEVEELRGFIAGKTVMVTGAGGSIGSELSRQVARYAPACLLLVERSEPSLFEIHRHLVALWPELDLQPLVLDVADGGAMRGVLEHHRPQVILHAAAHKHVPLMEINAREAIHNNTLATHRLATLAGEHDVERFVLISTDKAVRPTSVMGATKRLAELLIQDLDRRYSTRFLAVRFGNVLGSAGSVIPIFRQQIEEGGPITVTHPDMTRYFMTIPEASQLVLHAASMGQGGEIFVLDMGEPIKILDLAREMGRLAGLEVGRDIDIDIVGLRPGEKLVEELGLGSEQLAKTRHRKIFIGRLQAPEPEVVDGMLTRLGALSTADSPGAVRRVLMELLPESQLEPSAEELRQPAGSGGHTDR